MTDLILSDRDNFSGLPQVLQEVTYDHLAQAETDRKIYTLGHDLLAQFTKNATYTSGTNTVFLYDGHGSTRALTTMAGALAVHNSETQIFKYDAYGVMFGLAIADALTTYLYSGEPLDTNIGKQYLDARYYDLETGMFNRLDPFFGNLKDPQSFHKYLYTHNDPVNRTDPTGLNWITRLGQIAHNWISRLHARQGHRATYGSAIEGIGGAILPDIVDYTKGEIGEIKPLSPWGITAGPVQVNTAVALANGIDQVYRGNAVVGRDVAHDNPDQDGWRLMTWQPGVNVYWPGQEDIRYANTLLITMGTYGGVTYYYRYYVNPAANLLMSAAYAAAYAARLQGIAIPLMEELEATGGLARDLDRLNDFNQQAYLLGTGLTVIFVAMKSGRFVGLVNTLAAKTMNALVATLGPTTAKTAR